MSPRNSKLTDFGFFLRPFSLRVFFVSLFSLSFLLFVATDRNRMYSGNWTMHSLARGYRDIVFNLLLCVPLIFLLTQLLWLCERSELWSFHCRWGYYCAAQSLLTSFFQFRRFCSRFTGHSTISLFSLGVIRGLRFLAVDALRIDCQHYPLLGNQSAFTECPGLRPRITRKWKTNYFI